MVGSWAAVTAQLTGGLGCEARSVDNCVRFERGWRQITVNLSAKWALVIIIGRWMTRILAGLELKVRCVVAGCGIAEQMEA